MMADEEDEDIANIDLDESDGHRKMLMMKILQEVDQDLLHNHFFL